MARQKFRGNRMGNDDIDRKQCAGNLTRRRFFDRIGDGLYGAALATVLTRDLYGGDLSVSSSNERLPPGHRTVYNLTPRKPDFPPTAKSVIQFFMNGGPSHVDLFDPKPALDKHDGQSYFDKLAGDLLSPQSAGGLMKSPFTFKQYGNSGIWVSELMPHLAQQVDNITLIRSMYSVHPNHEPALFMIHSGRTLGGRPSMGSWAVFGLGTENQNLPAYVVLDDPLGLPINGIWNWQSGFLPPLYQGTRVRATGSPILNLHPEVNEAPEALEGERNMIASLDRIHKKAHPGQLQLDARMSSYQLAARLQLEASDALDISKESPATLEMYGIGQEPTDSYGRRCLMARRMVERGVRFIQLYINSQIWDTHTNLVPDMKTAAQRTDKPVAALMQDLKRRGLMESTLLIWAGEFGRMPISQSPGPTAGRDHNPRGFSLWMAGGGVKAGFTYGSTDEVGYEAVDKPVSVADWHATILHLLGLNYDGLIFDQNGFPDKLTSIYPARVVRDIIA